jgi:hypothetical protein
MTTNDDKSAPVRPVGPMGLIDECNCGGLGDGDSFSHDEDCPEGERLVRAYEEERDAPPAQPVTGCGKRMGGGLAPLKCGERTELRTVLCIDCSPAQPVTEPPKSVVTGETSDGYHTFNELYEHRFALWMALCRFVGGAWRSWLHSDGTFYNGWFVLGIGVPAGEQITYHLPLRLWDETDFAVTTDRCPVFDGHTSADVIKRIAALRPVTAQPVREQGEADQQLPSVLPVETPPDVLIAALSDTVDRLPFVVEQRDGNRVWMLRFPGGERPAREATYAEAMLWLALRIERLERRDRGAQHTFEAGPLVKPTPQSSPTAGPGPDDGDDDDCEEDPLTGQLVSATVGRLAAPPPSTGGPAKLCACVSGLCALRAGQPTFGRRCRENAPDAPAAAPPRKTPGELALDVVDRVASLSTEQRRSLVRGFARAITADRGGR